MACSNCCYTGEDCPDCGECFCECRCDDEHEGRDPCFHCGSRSCAGYCDDYQTYNLRPAETGAGCNCTCPIAGCHDPDCAVYGPPQEPDDARHVQPDPHVSH